MVESNLRRVAEREADVWVESMKSELISVHRPMEVFLASCFLMCRHVEAQADRFEMGDLRRRFYNEVHDALVNNERLAEELKKGTEALRDQCKGLPEE